MQGIERSTKMSTNNPLSDLPPLGAGPNKYAAEGSGRFQPIDPLRVIRSYLWLLIAAGVVGVFLGAGSWFTVNKYLSKYTSEAALGVTLPMINDNVLAPRDEDLRIIEPRILTEVNVIRSQEILNLLLKQKEVQETHWYAQFNNNVDAAREDLDLNILGVGHIRDTTLIRITATTAKQTDAQTLVRNLYQVYLNQVEERAASQFDTDSRAFQQKTEDIQERVRNIEARISSHLEVNPESSDDLRNNPLIQELLFQTSKRSEFTELLGGAQASYNQLQGRLDAGDFEPADGEIQQINLSIAIQQIDAQIRQLRVSRETQLDGGLMDSHPLIQQIDSQIRNTELVRKEEFDKQARDLFNARLEQGAQAVSLYEEQVRALEPQINELQLQIEDIQRSVAELETMRRELNYLEVQREEARVQMSNLKTMIDRQGNVTVKLRNRVTVAEQTFPPKWYVMIPGITFLFFGLVLGLVFLRELLDQRVKAAADIKSLSGAALLGIIPDASEDPSGKAPVERIVEQQPTGLLAESFRQVRSAVLSKMDRRGYKTLAVSAAKPKAGTSSVLQNLSASMALSGRRVLIIDANFRQPSQAVLAGAPTGHGLAEILSGRVGLSGAAGCIHQAEGLSLSVLPAGNTAGTAPELLENPNFRNLLAQLESDYDIILIDTPPSLLTSEAQLMCKHVDAMLLVARARSDTRGMLQRMAGQLNGQRAELLGVVLNGVQASAGGYLRRNFQEFHRYRDQTTRPRKADAPAIPDVSTNGSGASASSRQNAAQAAEDSADIIDALHGLNDLDDIKDFDKDEH